MAGRRRFPASAGLRSEGGRHIGSLYVLIKAHSARPTDAIGKKHRASRRQGFMRARARATQKASDVRFRWRADLALLQGWWHLCADSGRSETSGKSVGFRPRSCRSISAVRWLIVTQHATLGRAGARPPITLMLYMPSAVLGWGEAH